MVFSLSNLKLSVILSQKVSYRFLLKLTYFAKYLRGIPRLFRYRLSVLPEIGMFGNTVFLDASTICQLKCPTCPTGGGLNKNGVVGAGYLKFIDFRNFVNNNPQINLIELANWGEIFLNPEIKEIISYAYRKGVKLTARNGTNLNNVGIDVLEALVKYKFQALVISLDGATGQTYQKYRRGGNFNQVLDNIKIINEFKKKYNSDYPKLSWQFVIFGHNEHEILKARKMAEELNMEFRPKLNYDPNFSPVKDVDLVRNGSRLGVASRDEFKKKYKVDYLFPCYQLWNSPQINWDGKLLGCCYNKFGDFGNVFENGLNNTLISEKYIYAKKMLIGMEKARFDIPCSECPIYVTKVLQNPLKKKNIIIYF